MRSPSFSCPNWAGFFILYSSEIFKDGQYRKCLLKYKGMHRNNGYNNSECGNERKHIICPKTAEI